MKQFHFQYDMNSFIGEARIADFTSWYDVLIVILIFDVMSRFSKKVKSAMIWHKHVDRQWTNKIVEASAIRQL